MLISKHLELFCQTILGLGLIIWLQEDERLANQQLTAKTRYLDSHDHLTGALNRDALIGATDRFVATATAITIDYAGAQTDLKR